MRADTTGLFYWACSTTGLFCDAGRLAIAQLGYFIAAHNWVICDAGFESRTVAIAQLGYFMQHTTGLFHSSTQLGYFTQLGYL